MKPVERPRKRYNLSFFIDSDLEDLSPVRITVTKCNSDPDVSYLLCTFRETKLLDKEYLIDSEGLIIDLNIDLEEGFYCIQGFLNESRNFNKKYYVPFNMKQLIIGYKYSIYEPLKV